MLLLAALIVKSIAGNVSLENTLSLKNSFTVICLYNLKYHVVNEQV